MKVSAVLLEYLDLALPIGVILAGMVGLVLAVEAIQRQRFQRRYAQYVVAQSKLSQRSLRS